MGGGAERGETVQPREELAQGGFYPGKAVKETGPDYS